MRSINDLPKSNNIKILNIDIDYKKPFEISRKENSKFIGKALIYSHKLALNNKVAGLINCPIDKSLLKKRTLV